MNTFWKSLLAAALAGGVAALAQGGWNGEWNEQTLVAFAAGALTGVTAYLTKSPRQEQK
jgi:hypothetical protein